MSGVQRAEGSRSDGVDPMHYWAIDIPGLQRAEAEDLLVWVRSQPYGRLAHLVNPSRSLTLSMDEQTVEILLAATTMAAGSVDGASPIGSSDFASLSEEFRAWLGSRGLSGHGQKFD